MTDLTPQAATDDLKVLSPGIQLRLRDKTLTLRELTFNQLLNYGMEIDALSAGYTALPPDALVGEKAIDTLVGLLTQNSWALRPLLLECSGQTEEWLESLSLREGLELMLAWWQANKDFFIGRRARSLAIAPAGDTSSPSLSATDTGSPTSDTTPPAS